VEQPPFLLIPDKPLVNIMADLNLFTFLIFFLFHRGIKALFENN